MVTTAIAEAGGPLALLWQPCSTQRITKAFGERWVTVYARKLAAETECWLQLAHPRGGRARFLQPAEFCKSSGQLNIRDAVRRIGLNGPICSATGFVVTAAQQMTHCLRVESREGPWVKWAEPHAPLAPLDRPLCFSAPTENDAAQNIGQGG